MTTRWSADTMSSTEPLDTAATDGHLCLKMDKFYPRGIGDIAHFSQVDIPASTLSKVTGAQGQLHRAEGRELTHVTIGQVTGAGDRPVGVTLHWDTPKGLVSATKSQMHHVYDDKEVDRYNTFSGDAYNQQIKVPLDVKTIPEDKAKATAARWDDVDHSTIADAIEGIRITDKDGKETEHALIPKASALGRLYELNDGKSEFANGSTIKSIEHNGEPHFACDLEHANASAAQLQSALQDDHKIHSLKVTSHFLGDEPPSGPVHMEITLHRRECDPLGVQSIGEDGTSVDHGDVELPSGISAEVLGLVDGEASKVETIEAAGGK